MEKAEHWVHYNLKVQKVI